MLTLMDTVNQTNAHREAQRISRVRPLKNINISASVDVKKSTEFHHCQVRLSRIPLLFAAGASEDGPIVIDRNHNRIGKTGSGYVPKVIVLSGKKLLRENKHLDKLYCSAWVGRDAIKPLHILAAQATASGLSSSDLNDKLRTLIQEAYAKKNTAKSVTPYDGGYDFYPYIRDFYPLDNYVIFQMDKAYYRQSYKVDAKTRNITLDGDKVQVVQTYVDAPTGDMSSAAYVDTQHQGPAQGTLTVPFATTIPDVINYGSPLSELNNPQWKQMLNVEDALDQYLSIIKNGFHKPVGQMGLVNIPPRMINASREISIALKHHNIDPAKFTARDFMQWQDKKLSMKASQQTKIIEGSQFIADDFAYVGDERDISTWHLPIATKELTRHSLSIAASCSSIPKFERAEVRNTLNSKAKEYGLTEKEISAATHEHHAGEFNSIKSHLISKRWIANGAGSNGSKVFSKGAHHMELHKDGSWAHMDNNSLSEDLYTGKGKGLASIKKYMTKKSL